MYKPLVEKKERPKLKVDKHLPQIILPLKARQMFKEWWNSDIRFETSIPKVFNSGYLIIDDNFNEAEVDELAIKCNNIIKDIAKRYKVTYRQAESMFKDYYYCLTKITMYFTFITNNSMRIELYDRNDELSFTMDFGVGDSEPEPEITVLSMVEADYSSPEEVLSFESQVKQMLFLLVTTLWYIATTTKSTKYIYERKTPVVTSRHKNIVNVSDTKTINTPIYDFNKVRVVKTEQLQTRKKGWTYSHSFQVHGHYRHYKNGKTIFVQSYIKGKDKEFKQQTIIVEPKN